MRRREYHTSQALPVLTDVHGNLNGLEQVLATLEAMGVHNPPLILGDIAWNTWMNYDAFGVIDRVMRLPVAGIVCGNTDTYLVNDHLERWRPRDSESTVVKERMLALKRRLGREHLAFLRSLPTSLEFTFADKRIYATHASPAGVEEGLALDLPAAAFKSRLAASDAPCIVTGHLHRSFTHVIDGKIHASVGAVGRHAHEYDGIIDFAVLDVTPAGGLAVVHHRLRQRHEPVAIDATTPLLPGLVPA